MQYFVKWRGKVEGPLSETALEQKIRSNEISRIALVSGDGKTWTALAKTGIYKRITEESMQKAAPPRPDPAKRVPSAVPVPKPASAATIFCPKCGRQNNEDNFNCTFCSFVLQESPGPQHVVAGDGTMGGLIPYKNAAALWAYYLGVFSLIPCIGIPLGVAALILGIIGLNYASLHPEARGRAHAWTGIILGGICALGYTLLVANLIM